MIATFMLTVLAVQAQDTPPSIAYPGARQSNKWIDIGGTSVAVDRGITWKGVTAYLSLTCELVAVDDKTGKTLWSADVGAFWNAMTFKEHTSMDGKKVWAVELAPGPGVREGADLRQYHELTTGRKIEPQGEALPRIELAGQWSGRDSGLATPLKLLVENEVDWKAKVLKPMFDGRVDAPDFRVVDFTKHRVLVISSGDSYNCLGIGAQAWSTDDHVLVRLEYSTVQTGPEGIKARPWGIFVLPKAPATVVVERNAQHYLGGPAIWKEMLRFDPK